MNGINESQFQPLGHDHSYSGGNGDGGEVGRFPSLGLISPDAAMGYWIQYWGGKRENSIENIEKV